MRGHRRRTQKRGRGAAAVTVLLMSTLLIGGCARLPYTTQVLHEDPRVMVKLVREVDGSRYAHPVTVTSMEMAAILRGFSLREQKSLPMRWFQEEKPPMTAFREDEVQTLAPLLVEALQKAGPNERVAYSLYAPGKNPAYYREETSGWVAVQDKYFHLTVEYYHTENPSTKFSHYDWYYPTPPFPPGSFVLYFEPGRFWLHNEEKDDRGLDFKEFLKTVTVTKPDPPVPKP